MTRKIGKSQNKFEKARGGPTIHSFGCYIIIPELAAPNCTMGIFIKSELVFLQFSMIWPCHGLFGHYELGNQKDGST